MEQEQRRFMKIELQTALRDKALRVFFTKKDKSERAMVCTLDTTRIPADQLPKGAATKEQDHLIVVWDLEKAGWRSIIVDNVTGLEVVQ
jgi:hypothetical protein